MTGAPLHLTGRRASLLWTAWREAETLPGPVRAYRLEPAFEGPILTTLHLVAPSSLRTFETLLRQGKAERDDWRRFLSCCRLAEGEVTDEGRRVDVFREIEALPALEDLASEDMAEEIRPGTGPALLPVPGGRVPLNDSFLAAIRRNEEFAGEAGEGVGRGTLHLWAVPQPEYLNVLLVFHDLGPRWTLLLNPFRIPAGALYGLP